MRCRYRNDSANPGRMPVPIQVTHEQLAKLINEPTAIAISRKAVIVFETGWRLWRHRAIKNSGSCNC